MFSSCCCIALHGCAISRANLGAWNDADMLTGGAGGVSGILGIGIGAGGSAGHEISESAGSSSSNIAGTGGSDAVKLEPPCLASARQVVLVGDSYMKFDGVHSFTSDLMKAVGGSAYRDYSQFATWLAVPSGDPNPQQMTMPLAIPEQYAEAVREDPGIVAVIMNGGRDDIFNVNLVDHPEAADCKNSPTAPTIKACQDLVADVLGNARMLWMRMADDGVSDVVYMSYPHVPIGTATSTSSTNPNAMLDYMSSMMAPLCESIESTTFGKLRCHFVDLVAVFDGHPDWFATVPPGVDPNINSIENFSGSAAMAATVAKLLTDECIAKDLTSRCCRP